MELYDEIENSFQIIEKWFSKENLQEFKDTPVSDLYLYHFGLGIWIRNDLLNPQKSHLYDLFSENGIEHQDDMSSLIINQFHEYISNKI